MRSQRVGWILICAAVLLLLAGGQIDMLVIAAPLSLLVAFLAAADQHKIGHNKWH